MNAPAQARSAEEHLSWDAMAVPFERFSKRFDPERAEYFPLPNVNAALTKVGEGGQVACQSYWRSAKEAAQPFVGANHRPLWFSWRKIA